MEKKDGNDQPQQVKRCIMSIDLEMEYFINIMGNIDIRSSLEKDGYLRIDGYLEESFTRKYPMCDCCFGDSDEICDPIIGGIRLKNYLNDGGKFNEGEKIVYYLKKTEKYKCPMIIMLDKNNCLYTVDNLFRIVPFTVEYKRKSFILVNVNDDELIGEKLGEIFLLVGN
jgi:hypothetical protein